MTYRKNIRCCTHNVINSSRPAGKEASGTIQAPLERTKIVDGLTCNVKSCDWCDRVIEDLLGVISHRHTAKSVVA